MGRQKRDAIDRTKGKLLFLPQSDLKRSTKPDLLLMALPPFESDDCKEILTAMKEGDCNFLADENSSALVLPKRSYNLTTVGTSNTLVVYNTELQTTNVIGTTTGNNKNDDNSSNNNNDKEGEEKEKQKESSNTNYDTNKKSIQTKIVTNDQPILQYAKRQKVSALGDAKATEDLQPCRLVQPGGSGASFLSLQQKEISSHDVHEVLKTTTTTTTTSSSPSSLVYSVQDLAMQLQCSTHEIHTALESIPCILVPSSSSASSSHPDLDTVEAKEVEEEQQQQRDSTPRIQLLSEEVLWQAKRSLVETLCEEDNDYEDSQTGTHDPQGSLPENNSCNNNNNNKSDRAIENATSLAANHGTMDSKTRRLCQMVAERIRSSILTPNTASTTNPYAQGSHSGDRNTFGMDDESWTYAVATKIVMLASIPTESKVSQSNDDNNGGNNNNNKSKDATSNAETTYVLDRNKIALWALQDLVLSTRTKHKTKSTTDGTMMTSPNEANITSVSPSKTSGTATTATTGGSTSSFSWALDDFLSTWQSRLPLSWCSYYDDPTETAATATATSTDEDQNQNTTGAGVSTGKSTETAIRIASREALQLIDGVQIRTKEKKEKAGEKEAVEVVTFSF